MRKRRFYTFSCWYGCSCKGLFLSCGDIWCSILVYHLFAVCALLVSLVVCCAACSLIMRYRANDSLFCLLVVHIRQRAFMFFHIERYYFLLCGWSYYNNPLAVMVSSLHLLVRRLFPFCCTFFCLVVYGAALPY